VALFSSRRDAYRHPAPCAAVGYPEEESLTASVDVRRGSDFAALCRQIQAANLLDRRRGNYSIRAGLTLLAYAAAWAAFVWIGHSWWQAVTAAVLGITFTQVAFLGHDGGHRQIFRTRMGNDTLGIVLGDLLTGLSFGWWVDKHNRHHAHPNQENHDPDISDGVLAFTTSQVETREARTGGLSRFMAAHQGWLFFPLLTLEGLNLHVASLLSLIKSGPRRYRRIEIALFTTHVLAYLTAIYLVAGPLLGLVVIAVHQAVFGLYMGCSFAPNHKGMPIIPSSSDLDFLRRQVLTSRNVRGGWFVDVLLGGLNYQVEHHLFPNMPRPSLRKAQRIVRSYCADNEIHYTETSLLSSYVTVVRYLHQVGAPLRAKPTAAACV
jgi:fatty acid desaturase